MREYWENNAQCTKGWYLPWIYIFFHIFCVTATGFEPTTTWFVSESLFWIPLQSFKLCACFQQGVTWHSGYCRVWIHSKTRTWHDNNIQSYFRFQAAFHVFKLSVHDEIKLSKLYHSLDDSYRFDILNLILVYLVKCIQNALTHDTLLALFFVHYVFCAVDISQILK